MRTLNQLELIHFDETFKKPVENLEFSTHGRIRGGYEPPRAGKSAIEGIGRR